MAQLCSPEKRPAPSLRSESGSMQVECKLTRAAQNEGDGAADRTRPTLAVSPKAKPIRAEDMDQICRQARNVIEALQQFINAISPLIADDRTASRMDPAQSSEGPGEPAAPLRCKPAAKTAAKPSSMKRSRLYLKNHTTIADLVLSPKKPSVRFKP